MALAEWMRQFRVLHERARRNELKDRELATYNAGREELARALLAAQHVALQPGQKPRRALRVRRALQVDLEFHDGTVRALTLDVSATGFSALVAKPPRVDDELKVQVRIPGGEPLRAGVRVCEVKQQPGTCRVGLEFLGLDPADAERVELFVFDAVLEQLQQR